MSIKKRGLGHNSLDVLLSSQFASTDMPSSDLPKTNLALTALQPGRYQPRRQMTDDGLSELAASIKAQGVIQPLIVRPISEHRFEIIAGERRFRAAHLAGLTEVPVVIRDVDDRSALAMALIENIQRENLNPLEEALSLKRLMDEFQLSHEAAAEAVGKSRSTVTNLLRLLNLNPEVKALLEKGQLEFGHAKVLLALTGDLQTHLAKQVTLSGWTVRETEDAVRKALSTSSVKPATKRATIDPNILRLENELSDRLAARVAIQHHTNGQGKLVIQYHSLDELEGIITHIRGKKSS